MNRLVLMISQTGLEVRMTTSKHPNEPEYKHYPFDEGADVVQSLEAVVYDTPVLTADWDKVHVVIDNRRFFVMDSADATDAEVERRLETLWPADNHPTEFRPLVTEIETGRTVLVSAVERPLLAFVRRTWNNPDIKHRVGVLARYYGLRRHVGNMDKIQVRIHPGKTDIVAYGRDGLLLANTFDTRSVNDAAYYVLGAAQNLEYDNETDRIYVGGDNVLRDELLKILRQYVTTALPEIMAEAVQEGGGNNTNMAVELVLPALI